MEVIEINAVRRPQRSRRKSAAEWIMSAAIKTGLFAGTAAVAFESIILAVKFAQARASMPGGEIFTVPLIVALFVSGYVMRGDVESARRRRRMERREQRRKPYDQLAE